MAFKYPFPEEVDKSKFSPDNIDLEANTDSPSRVKFCTSY